MINVVRRFCQRVSILQIALIFLRLLKNAVFVSRFVSAAPPPSAPLPPPSWWRLHQKLTWARDFQFPNQKRTVEISNNDGHNLPPSQSGICPTEKKKKTGDGFFPSKKRPAPLAVPTIHVAHQDFMNKAPKMASGMKESEVIEGRDFVLLSKKGRREFMEDRHAIVLDISGDPKQAFFAVIDGHGGHAAAEYVAENLGKNIVNELEEALKVGNQIEAAIHRGYSTTDKQFLAQDVNGGACAAGVLVRDGELHAANVGDCKIVLSQKGKAIPLTNDHSLSREDERTRIENSGGYLHDHNGVVRVNGSVAVSRAFGDLHLKDWIICDPEIVTLPLTPDCDFLIVASDGLWDKVSEQEAVDIVAKGSSSLESCRKLIGMSADRGNRDDITIMMVSLQNFKNRVS